MKKEKVIISRKAQTSIKEIFDYLKRSASLPIAQKVKSTIIQECKNLKDFSGYSQEKYLDELEGDYRSVTIWDYNIIYSVKEDTVRILNVIHTSRHPDKRKDI